MLAGSAPRKNLARLRNPRAEYYAWKMEETERILDELRTQSEAGVPIIVEGRRDEAALRRLGVAGGGGGPGAGGGSGRAFFFLGRGGRERSWVYRLWRGGRGRGRKVLEGHALRRGEKGVQYA